MIKPFWFCFSAFDQNVKNFWLDQMCSIEKIYFTLLNKGLKAQAARGVLPNDLKTEINVKANLREWRTIFKLRTAPAAHPDMRRVMTPLLMELKAKIPVVFDDIPLNYETI